MTAGSKSFRPSSPRAMARAGALHDLGVYTLLAGAFLPIADFFIVNVALPTIASELHASAAALELVIAAYGIAYAAVLVLGGRLGDRFGRHIVFQVGLIGFILMSLACGLATNIGMLVVARVVQGATAALLIPQVLAISHATLAGERKARALALYGATSGIAAVFGQLAGGLLVSADVWGLSWRPIFLINVPAGILVLLVARALIPANRAAHPLSLDVPGTVLFAATLTAVLLPLSEGHSQGWPAWCWLMLLAASALAVATVIVEKHTEDRGKVPLLPPSLLGLPSMARGLPMMGVFSMGFGAFMFVFALSIQHGLHASPLSSGLTILPMGAMFFVVSVFSTRLIHRFGRAALAAGGIVQGAGLALLVTLFLEDWPTPLWLLALPIFLLGAGQSILFAGLFRAVLADVPPQFAGVGSGALITLQQAGFALGVATIGTVYLALEPFGIPSAFAVSIGIQLVATVLLVASTLTLPRFKSYQGDGDAPPIEL